VIALDLAEGMLREATGATLLRRFRRVCGEASALPLRDGGVDLVFSNLMLQCAGPDAVFGEAGAAEAGRAAHFTTFGPIRWSSCAAPGPRTPGRT